MPGFSSACERSRPYHQLPSALMLRRVSAVVTLGILAKSLSLLKSQFDICAEADSCPPKSLPLCFHKNRILLGTGCSGRRFQPSLGRLIVWLSFHQWTVRSDTDWAGTSDTGCFCFVLASSVLWIATQACCWISFDLEDAENAPEDGRTTAWQESSSLSDEEEQSYLTNLDGPMGTLV